MKKPALLAAIVAVVLFGSGGVNAQWQIQTTISGNPPLYSIDVVSDKVAWIGSLDTLYRTTDGGMNWIPTASVPTTSEKIACIEALDADTAYVGGGGPDFAGGNAGVYRTTNGGQTWTTVYTATGPLSYWDAIHFFDNLNGVALSDPVSTGASFHVIKTSNGGLTWTPIASQPIPNVGEYGLQNMYFHDSLHGWFGTGRSDAAGSAGRVFRTTDGGNTWTGFASGNTGYVSGVRFVSPLVGVRTSYDFPTLARSTNGGLNWAAIGDLPIPNISFISSISGVHTPGGNQLWVTGFTETNLPFVITSVDDGITWYTQDLPPLPTDHYPFLGAVSFGAQNDSVRAFGCTLHLPTFAQGGQILTYRRPLGYIAGALRRVPQQYATIQSAISACSDGDTVLVTEGTYLENIRYYGKKIIVGSQFLLDGDTSHIARTIIDGSRPSHPDSGSVVSFIDGEDTTSVLTGFTITGGKGTILSTLGIVARGGGGVLCFGGGAGIRQNRIVANVVDFSGDYAFGGGVYSDVDFTILENNEIVADSVTAVNVWGAGIFTWGDARIVNNCVENNVLTALGGTTSGGGIGSQCPSQGGAHVLIHGNIIRGNASRTSASSSNGCYGGGLDIYYPTVELIGNSIVSNSLSGPLAHGPGFRVIFTGDGSVVDGNLVAGNRGTSGSSSTYAGGGAIYYCSPLVSNNMVFSNDADLGGGVHIVGPTSSANVQSSDDTGGGHPASDKNVASSQMSANFIVPVLINNTIAHNLTGSGVRISNASPVMFNDILWGNANGEIEVAGGVPEVHYSDIQNGWANGAGNIDADPSFIDTLFRIDGFSPCASSGVDSLQILATVYQTPPLDFFGNPRPLPIGTHPDMGAHEVQQPLAVENHEELPLAFSLSQNYPNPFNPTTTIEFTVPRKDHVVLRIVNVLGQHVATMLDEDLQPGTYKRTFEAVTLASGIYFYQLQSAAFTETRKMLLVR